MMVIKHAIVSTYILKNGIGASIVGRSVKHVIIVYIIFLLLIRNLMLL